MDTNDEITMIRVTKYNRAQLLDIGKKGDTFDDVITNLIEFYRKYEHQE